MGNGKSILDIYKRILIIMIPVIVSMVVIYLAVTVSVRERIMVNSGQTIEIINKNFESELSAVNYSLMAIMNEPDIKNLQYAENTIQAHKILVSISDRLSNVASYYGYKYYFFYYQSLNDTFLSPVAYMDGVESITINNTIRACLNEEDMGKDIAVKWNYIPLTDDSGFVIKLYRIGADYIGAWLHTDAIYQNFGVNDYSRVGNYMFFSEDGKTVLNQTEIFEKLTGGSQIGAGHAWPLKLSGNYQEYSVSNKLGNFSCLFLINVLSDYNVLIILITMLALALIMILFTGIFLLVYIRRELLKPLRLFVNNQDYQVLADITENDRRKKPLEFQQMQDMFLGAKEKIEKLTISMYEKELEKKKIELDFLQLQIKPHFYLNCMTIIYNMAEVQEYTKIQEFSMALAEYMRELFMNGSRLIPMYKEFKRIHSYLVISNIRYDEEAVMTTHLEEEDRHIMIPPLLIQSLVENSVKAAVDIREQVQVDIWLRHIDDNMIEITVEDNGPGFTDEMLEYLNSGAYLTRESTHGIGLKNTKRRIDFFSENRGRISFARVETGGASVKVVLPGNLGNEI